ncbi:MAG: hypothetical protein A2504_14460 [Bdellovibrionales bacterium RIFOXYD12_FULL_39_22]|nr:MAG: hypothetical protein A2385_04895 [Bdellovibrionales bacterium RIFOXYB1_FULL_39_21]OFZ43484.1 MAG: hypothetical protein A2485_13410 [Bdellovibrionales bacterium RIFOXYC12_FULL_39_17]OFZ47027.1 MAG: hypothetical protein A2404_00470 [Bdellovibrionales bacterium RIFOXYC1_FULL_39_130]OFZ71304.1 MAG: hypothetical protein A2451_15500 [Bdellovibrionales bacterium RIFOXYC2_FULL_39_8]OFZ76224.1 MAG: hypothetical protein A2560_07720 [Bdellovibrionales bacterium RIFOXYD1_FULL_39_84]OFZ94459.1 MAG:
MERFFDASVLLVDDESFILDILQATLKKSVRTIHMSERPKKAIEIARKKQIDLAVLDMKMPEMSGLQLLPELRKINPAMRAIFLTGNADKEHVQEALRMGVDNFLDKPFDNDHLKFVVAQSLEKYEYDRLLKDVLELFILHYTKLDVSKFATMPLAERDKAIRAALGVAKLKILNK